MKLAAPAGLPLACLLTAACAAADFSGVEQPAAWTGVPGARWRPLEVDPAGRVGFTPIPVDWSGVDFANALGDESLLESQMRSNGSGVAVGDVDADGRPDIYLARLDGPNVLYRNLGGWRFEDVTDGSGLDATGQFSTGATLADVDGDGDLDLILASLGGEKAVFTNDGEGRFQRSDEAGILGPSGAMSIALADVDGDLDLDLYLTNYKRASVLDLFSPEEAAFPNTVRETGDGFEVTERFREHYEIVERGGVLSRREKAEADELYLNDGAGRFEHVPFDSGAFRGPGGEPLEDVPLDWGLAARFGDLDDDGDPDLYVANDLHSPDRVWINERGGTGGGGAVGGAPLFRAVSPRSIRTTSASSMAVDFADIDRDGDEDVFVIDMLSRSSRLRKTQAPVQRVEQLAPGDIAGVQQVNRNSLLLNRGDGSFAEIGNYASVEASDWSWSALFLDVDLDGYEDLLVPNGHVRDLMDADTQIRLRSLPPETASRAMLSYEPLPTPNVAFRNRGDLTFEEVGERWGIASEPDISHGAAFGDFDGDGDLDVVVNRLGMPALLLRNDAPGARLAVRLIGRAPNTSGVGARIYVAAAGLPVQSDEIASGGGYLSGSEALAAFAMGEATAARIGVRWPDGVWSAVAVDGADRLYEIRQPEVARTEAKATARADTERADRMAWLRGDGTPRTGADRAPPSGPVFEPDPTFGPIHHEPPVDDAGRQPLLPLRLSQTGPSLAWHDLDADGDPDLLVGNGAGAAPGLYRNEGGRLTPVMLAGPLAPVDQTGIIPFPDGQGRTRVAIGLSSYEAPTAEAASVPAVIGLAWGAAEMSRDRVSPGTTGLSGGGPSATGPIAAADYDGDGWLDLFVGGRVNPGRYPEPASSRVLRGRPDGTFQPDPRDGDLFDGIGLVSGALFSDIDVDGDPDLVLATEWGPIRVLRNDLGRFRDATSELGLSEHTSRWNAVAAGDLDGDGRPDLIGASWGENTEYRATAERPLEVYFGDVDRNGVFDVIEAQRDDRIGGTAPLAGLGRLSAGVPGVSERAATHAAYADATVEDALGASPPGRAAVTGLAHTAFLNRGDRFEARPLPAEAQWSPSMGLAVADIDADGDEDVFLAQNFFATDEDSPRYDSGRGLWLSGDGDGGFSPLSAAASGVALYGDQRAPAVADVDADGRVDLVVGQNGAEVRLFRNVSPRRGLRVRLVGPSANPYGIGATIRVAYGEDRGPAREIRAGSGAGSHDDPVQVLGLSGEPTGVEVRWPGGEVELVPLESGQLDVAIRFGASG